ncbi:MAG: energy-coupling factor ABC transporter permease [Lachnospiraceae bacterium]|nr:energy-coupling factor ABC transporter permease [Lachnospiraceae bacterium]
MSKKERRVFSTLLLLVGIFGVTANASAMHIMEGYLPPTYCVAWGVLCIPFLVLGFRTLNKQVKESRKSMTMIAMAGAFIFVISSLKIPSVTGSCSHMTGTGLGAILFGPAAVSVLGIIVLLFQAILLAHGGLSSLGANTFSMAIAGPIVSWLIYKGLKKAGVNKKVTIFLAAAIGDLFTYCVTSVQLAMAYPSAQGGFAASLAKFLGIFATTQIPLAIIEGILTVIVIIALESFAQRELKLIHFAD